MTAEPSQGCIACSIFRKEIEALQADGRFTLPVTYLDSMLHMVPEQLEKRLRAALEALPPGQGTVLAYGDCCGHMEVFQEAPGGSRTEGINCCEIILGREVYRQLRREGAFFLMPEWARSWKKVFWSQLGLLGPCAKTFMQEMHTRLIYLDTGLEPVPLAALEEASEYMGLPLTILPVSLEPLLASLTRAAQAGGRHD